MSTGSSGAGAGQGFAGQSTSIPSNDACCGAVDGAQIGGMLPGVLESLQESAAATQITTLYYDSVYGSFNYPSFQKSFGTKSTTVANVSRWGESGTIWINNDMFWNGPAMLAMKVPLRQRWWGPITSGTTMMPLQEKPSFFYSWGAMYAAVKTIKMNMGGAGEYKLDRVGNWVAVMASCFSSVQRSVLMRLAGGGVIAETGYESAMGMAGPTASYAMHRRRWKTGEQVPDPSLNDGATGVIPLMYCKARYPVQDNWIMSIKTPHTSFQNPRVRRRPIDTRLLSEHFAMDIILANFEEVCDSGVGFSPVFSIDPNPSTAYKTLGLQQGIVPVLELHRQYGNGVATNFAAGNSLAYCHTAGALAGFLTHTQDQVEGFPTTDTLVNTHAELPLLTPETLPSLELTSVIASLRLTNDMLGAYDVLKTRTDSAIYYPFQHFTTQTYFVQNLQWVTSNAQGQPQSTLLNYIQGELPAQTSLDVPESSKVSNRATINIPVNPMTAMYITIFREKDHQLNPISKSGGYSPALYWNALRCDTLSVKYGAEFLVKYDSHSEYLMEQMYEHCSAFQIPYKGGACSKSELMTGHLPNLSGVLGVAGGGGGLAGQNLYSTQTGGMYHGVLRNAYIYEISFVEMEPLRNEVVFQQCPSFLGEQLELVFQVPATASDQCVGAGAYDPHTDFSFLDYYDTVAFPHLKTSYSHGSDVLSFDYQTTTLAAVYPKDKVGTGPGMLAQTWSLNNDNFQLVVVYAQNCLWQQNPNASKMVFARG